MKNRYIVKIKKKYLSKLFGYTIYCIKIKNKKEVCYLTLDEENYEKLMKFKNLFEVELVGYQGRIKYQKDLKQYSVFLIFFVMSLIYLLFLSKVIFEIEIKTNNKEMKELVLEELEKRNIAPYKMVVSFSEKEKIKADILKKNKDKLEWLEITRKGSKYIINVEERIKKEIEDTTVPQNIVASKNAIILSIEAKKGSIVKKLNDYVKKGEVIVTGEITHKEEIVDLVHADATIYGETWYTVHVSYPVAYYEKTYTGNEKTRLNFSFLQKNFSIGGTFKEEEVKETPIVRNSLLPIKISIQKAKEIIVIDDIYTVSEAYEKGVELAKEELLMQLGKDSRILSQKKLKIIINNSTIDIDVFFKVYENITATKEIEE